MPPVGVLAFCGTVTGGKIVMQPGFIGTTVGGKRVIGRCPARVVGPGVYSRQALGRVRRVLCGIMRRNLTTPTNSGRFTISNGANATLVSRNTTKCGSKQIGCLIDFYKCFPSRTPGCDYVISVRGPKAPTSKNLVTNDMFDGVTREICTGSLHLSVEGTVSAGAMIVPSMGTNRVVRTERMLRNLGVRARTRFGTGGGGRI